MKAVEARYASAKDLVSKQDYKGALATASEIPAKVKAALAAAAARKDELVKAVSDAAAELPRMIADLKEKVAALARSKKLPRGVDKAAVEKAEQGVAALDAGWQKLWAQVKDGAYEAAVESSKALKAQAQEIAKSIGSP